MGNSLRPARAAVPVLLIVAIIEILGATAATQDKRSVRLRTLSPGDILYVLIGGGGNTLALMRDDGVVVVDTKLPGWGAAIREAIEAATDRPVVTIINTHAHPDHAGGNKEFQGKDSSNKVEIVAHANAAAAVGATRTVTDKLTLLGGPDQIDLYYFGRGHTNGDLVVVFPQKRLAYFGDLFPSKSAPIVDVAAGGSVVALADTLRRAATEIKGVTRVVTGHEEGLADARDPSATSVDISTPQTMRWSDVEEYADFARDFVEAVRQARRAGKTPAEAAASLSLPNRYRDYDMRNALQAVVAIYREDAR
jgi:glyoxylase-like metal-dependent hydrolase (beta-lactamase superfamily II)